MVCGALWCVGGLAVTAVSYGAASDAGQGTIVVAWGAVLFGALQFLKGVGQMIRG
jgi:hypothetical protein